MMTDLAKLEHEAASVAELCRVATDEVIKDGDFTSKSQTAFAQTMFFRRQCVVLWSGRTPRNVLTGNVELTAAQKLDQSTLAQLGNVDAKVVDNKQKDKEEKDKNQAKNQAAAKKDDKEL